ncbi:hypothetical protein TanjilG_07046 [Lupinus angustifolius]|uniref:Uncharacterized protein n=1 Tax=Lupinus angustifolius TaxID=3871 RepID=A0A4P1QYC0_LUPAN|nr:hypothetical protein TanjilG_07046 [Lupinus angustifolius]
MEVPSEKLVEDKTPENPIILGKKNSLEGSGRTAKTVNTGGSVATRKRVVETRNRSVTGPASATVVPKRSGSSSGSTVSPSLSAPRRSSTGGLYRKPAPDSEGRRKTVADSTSGAGVGVKRNEPTRRSLPELRRSSLASSSPRSSITERPVASAGPSSRMHVTSSVSKVEAAKRPLSKPVSSEASISSRRVASSTADSSGGSSVRRSVSKFSSPLSAAQSSSIGMRASSLSSSSQDKSSAVSGRRKVGTPDSRESRFVVLPQVDSKASDDVRLDLRGHRVRSLNTSGLNLSSNLEVLDLSFNDFKGPGFEPLENCKVLQHFRVEENPIMKMPHLEAASILLVGPTLKKYNDRDSLLNIKSYADLSREEITLAKRYPTHTAFCIREGWEFSRSEHAADSTFRFLVQKWKDCIPPGFFLKEAFIDKPLEEDVCHCHFTIIHDGAATADPPLVLKYQWFCGEMSLSNFVPIADATSEIYWPKHEDIGKILKAECTPTLGETEYPSIFAISSPVSPGSGIPKVVNLEVHGELVEGSIIKGCAKIAWCGGTPGKGVASWLRRKWNSSPVAIVGAEDEEYQLTIDDVDSSLVFMYTPVTEEGAKGEPQYKYTDFVKAVSSVRIVGDAVEGSIIKGVGDYFGGREGPSKFEWLRENGNAGDFLLVSAGTSEYTLTKEDVGRRLAFEYIPINLEGQEGKSLSVMSPVVKQAPPKVTDVKIVGDLRENGKVTVTGIVTGGTEGSSRVQWFKTCLSTLDENSLEALSTSKIAKAFRIPLGAVGYYIVAKFIPMTPDGDAGEPAYAISDRAVETLPPSLNFLSIIGDYTEDGMLTASYGYVGGHEGKSIYNWCLHEVEGDVGSLIPGVSGILQYRITKEAIGKFISFQCTPVRDDGVVGDLRIWMGQERVRAAGDAVEGTTLSIEKKYWGGEEGDSVYRWFRTRSDGTQTEIMGATTASYVPSIDDIDFFISVSCEPVRSDWARGPMVLSEKIGPITPEFLDLTLEDVGGCIELIYTPVRKDGMKGIPKNIVSSTVSPADPKGMDLIIPECCEDQELIPLQKYFGGHEGSGEYIWFQTKDKVEGSALLDIFNASDVEICGTELTYKPSLKDVGAYLALYWVPTRADSKCGEPIIAISSTPVSPAPPVVSNVDVKELSLGLYNGEGEYFGGYEGESLFSWYRENNEGTIELINGANSKTYKVSDSDYNYRLLFGYTPVRSDSVIGELRLSDPTDVVLPELPYVEMVALTGKAVEGDVLTAVEVIPNSETQQHVWSKYKKDIKYQWFCSSEVGDSLSYNPIPNQSSCSYRVRLDDIGRRLKCQCVITDVFGRSGEVVYIETTPVLPGIPRIQKLEIEGGGFHTNLYAVRGTYSGGKEGKSKIQWLRSMVGSPDLISIPGETGKLYEANVDDVGYRLVAIYTPVREDGVEGQPISVSTEPIVVEPDVLKEVKQNLDLGSVKFEVLCDRDQTSKKVSTLGTYMRRILEINKKRIKVVKSATKTSFPTTEIRGSYAPPFHVEIFRNDQHRLKIVVDSENEADLMVHSRHTRDVIVLVIRGLAQRFNSTSLNSLLKIET